MGFGGLKAKHPQQHSCTMQRRTSLLDRFRGGVAGQGQANFEARDLPVAPPIHANPRPGQLLPPGARQGRRGSDWDEGDDRDAMLDEDAYEGHRRGQSTATADANSAQDRAWTLRRPDDEHAVARHYSGVTDMREKLHQGQLDSMQEELDAAWGREIVHHSCSCECPSFIPHSGDVTQRTVVYYSREFTGELTVHACACPTCGARITAPALAIGCFPSTPCDPAIFSDSSVLEMFIQFAYEGVSAHGKCLPACLPACLSVCLPVCVPESLVTDASLVAPPRSILAHHVRSAGVLRPRPVPEHQRGPRQVPCHCARVPGGHTLGQGAAEPGCGRHAARTLPRLPSVRSASRTGVGR